MTNRPDFPKVNVSVLNAEHLEILKTAKKILASTKRQVGTKRNGYALYQEFLCLAIEEVDADYEKNEEITLEIECALHRETGMLHDKRGLDPTFEDSKIAEWGHENGVDTQVLRHEWLDIIIKELENAIK